MDTTRKIITSLLVAATLLQVVTSRSVLATGNATASSQPKTESKGSETGKALSVFDSDFFSEKALESQISISLKQLPNGGATSATLRKPPKLIGLKETLRAGESQVV